MTINTISAKEFAERNAGAKRLAIIDVRSPAEVAGEGLPRAHNLPLQALDQKAFGEALNKLNVPENMPVYLLCQAGQRARMAADKALEFCSNPLVIVEGGIVALRDTELELQTLEGGVMSLERQVRIVAGALVLLGAVCGFALNPAFYGLSAFVGAGLLFAGITDTCAMGMLLARMPWNQVR